MRFITIAEVLPPHKPKGCDHVCRRYAMSPGTAWKMDVYGKHEVVEVDDSLIKRASYDYCTKHFDGREMAIFNVGDDEYLQPTAEDPRATERRLGSKRKIRKLKKQRREAPGVARAVSWENDGPAPKEDPADRLSSRMARLHDERESGKARAPGEPKPYRRAGPRGGLTLA